MNEIINDNQNFIYYLFNITAGSLFALSYLTHLSYQFWNILIWFGLIPAFWLYLISKKTSYWLNIGAVSLFAYLFIAANWDTWFNQAVKLLYRLCAIFGPDYRQMSVYVCLFLPFLITVILLSICVSKKSFKTISIVIGVIIILILILFPLSNTLLTSKYFGHLAASYKQS